MADDERMARDLVTCIRAARLHFQTGNPVEIECLNRADVDNMLELMIEFFPDVPATYAWRPLAAA